MEPPGFTEELIMKLALLLAGSFRPLATTNVIVSAAAIAIGCFIALSPDQAARIWGSQRLTNSTPEGRTVLIRWYRALGICVGLSGVLLALDTFGS